MEKQNRFARMASIISRKYSNDENLDTSLKVIASILYSIPDMNSDAIAELYGGAIRGFKAKNPLGSTYATSYWLQRNSQSFGAYVYVGAFIVICLFVLQLITTSYTYLFYIVGLVFLLILPVLFIRSLDAHDIDHPRPKFVMLMMAICTGILFQVLTLHINSLIVVFILTVLVLSYYVLIAQLWRKQYYLVRGCVEEWQKNLRKAILDTKEAVRLTILLPSEKDEILNKFRDIIAYEIKLSGIDPDML